MTRKIVYALIVANLSISVFAREFHVSPQGTNSNRGTSNAPFKTIMAAANQAQAGDTITVHAGTYREYVNPPRGGESETKRITYRAATDEKVYLKGSECIKNWKKVKDDVWKVTLPNSLFGTTNPYNTLIEGDWFYAENRIHHTGEVYLNGKSFYEVDSLTHLYSDTPLITKADPKGSTAFWYCQTDDTHTTIWANFPDVNPNKELVEINARETCFYPQAQGINYITLTGFNISQAATQWGAPTAEQVGMVATHWNKGWIIENNSISNSKCSGITLGKERSTGHNVWLNNQQKDGSLHYIEVTFRALKHGWNKSNIGSHIIRNNEISHCEQTGICGSMGAAFSVITKNHIHDIWTKRRFRGAEIGGIKFHAPIDTELTENRIHNTGRGIWLDWMTQGTRVSSNLLYDNDSEDLFVEVNHGPYLVDNNIFLSPMSVREQSEGGAFVHNLIGGGIYAWNEPSRYTPYHLPHTTEIAGLATIVNGDNRYYNNVFIGHAKNPKVSGLASYQAAKQPIYTGGNHFYNKAVPHIRENNAVIDYDWNPAFVLVEKGDAVYLSFTGHKLVNAQNNQQITTDILGKTLMVGARYENNDASPLVIDKDYFDVSRAANHPVSGPFEQVKEGKNEIRVW